MEKVSLDTVCPGSLMITAQLCKQNKKSHGEAAGIGGVKK